MGTPNVKESNPGETKLSESSDSTVKIETVVPNRVFIGGITANASEWDIKIKFSNFGTVKAVKIIRDHMGACKGYGFITFSSEAEAKRAIEKGGIILKGRKVNIAPAFRRQNPTSENQSCMEVFTEDNTVSPQMDRHHIDRKDINSLEQTVVPFVNEIIPYTYENSYPLVEAGPYNLLTDISYSYGNPQIYFPEKANFLPYPTLVYIPQQTFYCARSGITYNMAYGIPEMVPFAPLPICCINEQKL